MKHLTYLHPLTVRRIMFLALPLVGLISFAPAAHTLLTSAPAAASPAGLTQARVAATPVVGPTSRERGEVELITLRPSGFEPVEITRPAGRFLLTVTKRNLPEEVTLHLERERGGPLQEFRKGRDRKHHRGLVDLPPGIYVLTEAGHPDWVCRITITPR